MRVFVTGGTGLVGSRLVGRLLERGDAATVLTRRPAAARERFQDKCNIVEGDPVQRGDWSGAVADCDAVIHLAGEPIFGARWNDDFRARLRESRVRSTENIVEALGRAPRTAEGRPKVLVNASAIGYYGPHGDEELTEDRPPGDDFLARLTVDWEQAARRAEGFGARLVLVRIGVVLDKAGGALARMLTPFKLGIGGPIGSGRQWMSWIHHADVVGILLLGLDNPEASGPLNGAAPNPVTNKEFSKALGRAVHRPALFPIPTFALRLRFGGVAEVLTTGQRVLPRRPLALGYKFRFPDLDAALADVLV